MKSQFACLLFAVVIANALSHTIRRRELSEAVSAPVTVTPITATSDCSPALNAQPLNPSPTNSIRQLEECHDNCKTLCRVQRTAFASRKRINGCRTSCSRNRCRSYNVIGPFPCGLRPFHRITFHRMLI